jgi:hypothetical protein
MNLRARTISGPFLRAEGAEIHQPRLPFPAENAKISGLCIHYPIIVYFLIEQKYPKTAQFARCGIFRYRKCGHIFEQYTFLVEKKVTNLL